MIQLCHWAHDMTRHYGAGLSIVFDPLFTVIAYSYTMIVVNTFENTYIVFCCFLIVLWLVPFYLFIRLLKTCLTSASIIW